MRYLILALVAVAAVVGAQVWQGRTSTPFLHLQYVTSAVDNDNLDKIDAALQAAYAVLPTTTTVTTTSTTTTTT